MFMQYFNFDEFFASDAAVACGIKNCPPLDDIQAIRANIMLLVYHVLDPIRAHICEPVYITSGYRCAKLNELVGGSDHSQHMQGQAADFTIDSFCARDYKILACWCAENLDFDQLIVHAMRKFIHVSYVSPESNRHEVLFR